MNGQDQSRATRWPQPFAGLRGIGWADVPREASAGITLAALIIPLNIGYAQVAGLPPVVGLYAAIIPLVIFALFTSSRHVVGSPDASIAALVGATLFAFAAPGDPLRVQYAGALALMCGLLFFLFWYFRLAFLANFLSRAVLVGFISGLGIEVFTNQARKILGASAEGGSQVVAYAHQIKDAMAGSLDTEGYLVELLALLESIPRANLYSVAIGLGALVIVRLLKRYAPRAPGALVALILLTAIVAAFNLDEKGVSVLGAIPSGPPSLSLPDVSGADYLRLLSGAMAVVAITLCEGLLLVRQYSRKHGYKADGDQVLFAYGLANLAAGLSGAMVTGNSASRSAAMESAGSRSQLPSLIAAGTIALVMLFFTDMLAFLPNAALAGIVANAVLSLIEVGELRELYQMRRSEFWIAVVCLLSVLVLGPLRAVIIAFLLATIDVIRRASRPGTWVLCEAPDGSHFVPTETVAAPDASGLVVYRFGSPLYFANANLFSEEVEKLVTQGPVPIRSFVLDAEAMVDVDTMDDVEIVEFPYADDWYNKPEMLDPMENPSELWLKRDHKHDLAFRPLETALEKGIIDALYCQSKVLSCLAEATGNFKSIEDLSRYPDWTLQVANIPAAITCTDVMAEQHPELAVTFMKGMIKVGRWANEHKHAAAAILDKQTFYRDVEDTYEGIRLVDMVPNLSPQNLASVEIGKNFMLSHGYIKNDFDVQKWSAPEFLERAAKELLEERWKKVTGDKLPEASSLRIG